MRIKSLVMQGFRAFGSSVAFDMDAEAVIIVGVNGSGKTSIFDAILWALTGEVMRLGADAPVLSLWSDSGEVTVRLILVDKDGKLLKVSRIYDGTRSRLTLAIGEEQVPDALAQGTLVQHLWPVGLNNPDGSEAMALALTRAVYLQQDNVRDFIDADADEDRFRAISQLIGAGAVSQLQAALERSRNHWTRATTVMAQDLPALRERLRSLEADLERLGFANAEGPVSEQEWRDWVAACIDMGVDVPDVPPWTSTAAATVGDDVMRELGAVEQKLERRASELKSLAGELSSLASVPEIDPAELRAKVGELGMQVDASRQGLVLLRQQAAEQARQEAVRAEQEDDLKRLAAIALRHLDELCPVCAQDYDRDATRKRLERLLSAAEASADSRTGPIEEAAKALNAFEAELATRQAELDRAAQRQRERAARGSSLEKRLVSLGLAEGSQVARSEWVDRGLQSAGLRLNRIQELRLLGERLLLERARMADVSRRGEVEKELDRTKAELSELEHGVSERENTRELASKLIDALRLAGDELVSERLQALEPLARRIYRRIDPHPAFTNLHLKSWLLRGKGHMAPQLEDPFSQKVTDQPGLVLSSSQANALAVAIFLAVNLGVGDLPLDAALLDDPLQSLDDVNLLGLIDLLRRVMQRRQLVVSTHDRKFGQLLARKLRPTVSGRRTAVIELSDWQREGPQVRVQDILPADRPFQVVA